MLNRCWKSLDPDRERGDQGRLAENLSRLRKVQAQTLQGDGPQRSDSLGYKRRHAKVAVKRWYCGNCSLLESEPNANQIGSLREPAGRYTPCSRDYAMMLIRLANLVLLLALVVSGCVQDPNTRKNGYLEEGLRYHRAGKYNEAVIALKNALQIDPKFVAARHLMGRTYKAKSWNADAIRELQRALELQPDDVSIRVDLGQAYLDIEAYGRALAEGKAIQERAAGNAFGPYLIGAGTLGEPGQAEAALEPLSRALRLDAAHPEFH